MWSLGDKHGSQSVTLVTMAAWCGYTHSYKCSLHMMWQSDLCLLHHPKSLKVYAPQNLCQFGWLLSQASKYFKRNVDPEPGKLHIAWGNLCQESFENQTSCKDLTES